MIMFFCEVGAGVKYLQQNDNTISGKTTQQVETRQNFMIPAVKTNQKHQIATLQRRV